MAKNFSLFPLFSFTRGQIQELTFYGYINLIHKNKVYGPKNTLVCRSLLKPWQFLATGIQPSHENWAIGFASQSGEEKQLSAIRQLSQEHELDLNYLQCPKSYPFNRAAMEKARYKEKLSPQALFHPCAGKHLSILISCKQHDYDLTTYMDVKHPYQKKLQKKLAELSPSTKISWVTDGCGLPSAVMSSHAFLKLFDSFKNIKSQNSKNILDLWMKRADLIGGDGHLDTELMQAFPGRVFAKEGADGLFLIGFLSEDFREQTSILIKLAHGFSIPHLALSLSSVLIHFPFRKSAIIHSVAEYLRCRMVEWVPPRQEVLFHKIS